MPSRIGEVGEVELGLDTAEEERRMHWRDARVVVRQGDMQVSLNLLPCRVTRRVCCRCRLVHSGGPLHLAGLLKVKAAAAVGQARLCRCHCRHRRV